MGKIQSMWLAAWSCGLMLVTSSLTAGAEWDFGSNSANGDRTALVRGQDDEMSEMELMGRPAPVPYGHAVGWPAPEISHEDLSNLGGPFNSQFPELDPEVNPFYHGVETDRAAFVPALSSAPVGNIILESGYSFIANRHLPSEHSVPELVIRYGLTERMEARFGWNEMIGGTGTIVSPVQQQTGLFVSQFPKGTLSYVNRFMGGMKYRVNDQSGWFPASTFIFEGYVPSYGNTMKNQVSATYAIGWEFAPRTSLNASVRYATESQNRDNWGIWSPAVVFKAPFAERWTGHLESFAVLPHGQVGGKSQYFIGPGMQVLITPEFELNFRVGTGLNSASPLIYTTIGFGAAF
ncbi:MAG: transporter [Planctomycetes bacterium]|nr:transporter [Planctomycetota bacterium]